MGYVLTEEQQFLQDSAKDLLKKAPVSLVRELRDKKDELGFSLDLWNQMIEMGWPGLAVSEDHGGLSFGLRAMGILMEESGRSLSASPLLTVATSAMIIEKFGSDAHKARLSDVCEKGSVIALAVQEGAFYKPESTQLSATRNGDDIVLSGTKDVVLDAHVAEAFIVTASDGDGITAFLVDKDTDGISVTKEFMMDSRFYSVVNFENVKVNKDAQVGKAGNGLTVMNDVTSITNALLSAELVGVMSEALDRTVEYLKERRQFEKEIGSFQALQHRAADLYTEIEVAKSIALKALIALDDGDFMAPAFCSMAKAKCSKVAQLATNEGVQMFGGIGMTDDEEIGFFLKRARVAAQLFGGYSYHLDRFSRMNGY